MPEEESTPRDDRSPPAAEDAALVATVLRLAGLGESGGGLRLRRLVGGSSRSAKWIVESAAGPIVVKRRRESAESLAPRRQRFEQRHRIEMLLEGAGIPTGVPPGPPLVEHAGEVFELSRLLPGGPDGGSRAEAAAAGVMLARIHGLLARTRGGPRGGGSWHDAPRVRAALAALAAQLGPTDSGELVRVLRARYDAAAAQVEAGLADAPIQLIHGDYHPGNLLFRRGAVAGVLDWEALRRDRPLLEVASATLATGRWRGGSPGGIGAGTDRAAGGVLANAGEAPDALDVDRMAGFLQGYTAGAGAIATLGILPAAMQEAAIAAAVLRTQRRLAVEAVPDRAEKRLAAVELRCRAIELAAPLLLGTVDPAGLSGGRRFRDRPGSS